MAQREQDEGADEAELRLQRRLMQDIGDTRAEIESLRRELSSSPPPDGAGASSPTTRGDGTPQLEPEPESPQLTRTLTEAVFDRLCATPLLTVSLPARLHACLPACASWCTRVRTSVGSSTPRSRLRSSPIFRSCSSVERQLRWRQRARAGSGSPPLRSRWTTSRKGRVLACCGTLTVAVAVAALGLVSATGTVVVVTLCRRGL
jgi:hypothetical protein